MRVTRNSSGLSRATVAASAALALLLAGCDRQGEADIKDGAATPSPSAEPQPTVGELAVALPPLARADILAAANAAADAAASGQSPPQGNLALADRSFELRLPFGCAGQPADGWAGWRYDPATKVLKLHAQVEQWTNEPWLQAIAADTGYDAAEGFWLDRPWTTAETCPPRPRGDAGGKPPPIPPTAETGAKPNPAPRQTLALVQFFTPGASRTRQRGGRPYAVTVPGFAMTDASSFSLVLRGRMAAFPDGQPVRCHAADPLLPPRCAVSISVSGVALEHAPSGDVLANWTW